MAAERSTQSIAAPANNLHIQHGSIADLADLLLMARAEPDDPEDPYGRAVFWIGAGTSVSAGIPSGRALAGRLAQWIASKLRLVDTSPNCDDELAHEVAFVRLQRAGKVGQHHSLSTAYGELFARLGANDQRDFIRRVIVRTNRRQINWSHLAIGELVRQRVVHTLLTTNFDDLLLDGLVRCDQLPAIIDGVESLNRMDPQPPVPQLVYLHGSQHTYSPRNSTEAVLGTRDLPQAQGGLYGLLQHCSVLVVVGYAGNPGEGVMELLQERCRAFTELPIYWVAHGQQDSLSQAAVELLSSAKNARLIPGQDSDLFFRQLLREMRIGVPAWFRGPVHHLLHLADRIRVESTPQSAELRDEVVDFRHRLGELLPFWDQVGAQNQERREVRQLALSDNYREVWERLKERTLDDLSLLQMRAEAAFELGRLDLADTLERSVRDWSAVARRLRPGSAEWALAQYRLGDAQATLGERKYQKRAVEDALLSYGQALTVYSQEKSPREWASARKNQGLAQLTLIQLSGQADKEALHDAHHAFSDALTEYRCEAMPTEWAATKRDLGHVLQMLGRAGESTLLEEALAAYAEALQVQTPAQSLLDWTITTCCRAVAQVELGRIRRDVRLLRQAADDLSDALQIVGRDSHPAPWVCIQHHYGAALLALAEHNDEAALRQSVAVLREALHSPGAAVGRLADWACLSGHIGGALLQLRTGNDGAALNEATDVLIRACARLDGESVPVDHMLPVADLALHVLDELLRVATRKPAPFAGVRDSPNATGTTSRVGVASSRVLVVEDSEVDQLILRAMLEQCVGGLDLRIHDSGSAALENVLQFRPDLLILDLNLPDMQGGEVLACVKAMNPRLPVLLYSADPVAMARLRDQAGTEQGIATLQKGCSPDEFRRLVPTLFKRRQRDSAVSPSPVRTAKAQPTLSLLVSGHEPRVDQW